MNCLHHKIVQGDNGAFLCLRCLAVAWWVFKVTNKGEIIWVREWKVGHANTQP